MRWRQTWRISYIDIWVYSSFTFFSFQSVVVNRTFFWSFQNYRNFDLLLVDCASLRSFTLKWRSVILLLVVLSQIFLNFLRLGELSWSTRSVFLFYLLNHIKKTSIIFRSVLSDLSLTCFRNAFRPLKFFSCFLFDFKWILFDLVHHAFELIRNKLGLFVGFRDEHRFFFEISNREPLFAFWVMLIQNRLSHFK